MEFGGWHTGRHAPAGNQGGVHMKRALLFTLVACTLVAGTAAAQSDLGLKAVGMSLGFVSPEDLGGTVSFGVFADHGTIVPQVGLESRIEYWSSSEEAFGVETKVSDIVAGARAKYYFPVASPSIRPFAGGGLALHFVHAEASVANPFGGPAITAEDSQTKLGLDLGGGIAMPINPQWDFLGELWYGIVSDVGQFSLRAGLSYKLGS